jgi:mono/diheme cytochrome c family protein
VLRAGRVAACVVVLGGAAAIVQAQSGAPVPWRAQAARGELLYGTHCIACHTTQVHWRAKKAVTDWASLKTEVRRWAANGGLGWSDEEVVDVARYLNATIYRFPASAGTELGARGALPRS